MRNIPLAVVAALFIFATDDVSAWQYCYQNYAVCCQSPIVCSPVFFMPLQYAPSPVDGGYYYILPNGQVQGPNYYLRPPFNPIQGFDQTAKGQEIFLKVLKESMAPKKGQPQPPGHGLGNYNPGPSGPQTLPYFQGQGGPPMHHAAPPPGFGPPPPGPGFPPGGPGGGPPPNNTMIVRGQAPTVHTVGYHSANYGFNLPALPNPGYIPQPPPPMHAPGYAMAPVWQPSYGYYPNYAMAPVPLPSPGYNAGHTLPYIPLPTTGYAPSSMPYPGYTPNIPFVGYAPNNLPNPSYTPNLPNVGYEPPAAEPQSNCYPSHSLARSPRDFFMFNENHEDQKAKQSRPAMVP